MTDIKSRIENGKCDSSSFSPQLKSYARYQSSFDPAVKPADKRIELSRFSTNSHKVYDLRGPFAAAVSTCAIAKPLSRAWISRLEVVAPVSARRLPKWFAQRYGQQTKVSDE